MSIINFLRHSFKLPFSSRIIIQRCQSQAILDVLNKKSPVEIEINDDLENSPMENTIEWNKKLKFHRLRGEERKALKLFEIGIRKYQYQPDYITFVSMIEICKDIKDLDNGRYIHRIIHNSPVNENSRMQYLLMEMYIKCRDVDSAREVFNRLKNRTVVEFNMMLTAYNANQFPKCALDLFAEIRENSKIKANHVSYMLYFQACVMLKSFDQAKTLHEELKVKVPNYIKSKELVNQITTMYIESGDFQTAEELFKQIKEPSVENYTGLMKHFNEIGEWQRTIELYDQMKTQRKIQVDIPTFLNVLAAVKQLKNIDKAKEVQEDLLKQSLWQNHDEIKILLKEILQTSN